MLRKWVDDNSACLEQQVYSVRLFRSARSILVHIQVHNLEDLLNTLGVELVAPRSRCTRMLAEVYCKVWHKGHIPVRTAFGGVSIAGAPKGTSAH